MEINKRKSALLILLSLTTIISVYLINTHLILFDESYYRTTFVQHSVYEQQPDADMILHNLLAFFQNKQRLHEPYYTLDEVQHLADVKRLIEKGRLMLLMSVLLIGIGSILYVRYYKKIPALFLTIGGSLLTIAMVLSISSANFAPFFLNFHTVFFPQGNFLFPASSTLITLFPEAFFQDIFQLIVIRSTLVGVFLTVMGLLLIVPYQKKIYHNKV